MKMKIKILVAVILTAYALAEPPVGDYPYPDNAAQRSLSDTYGPPVFGARIQNQLSTTYGPPNQSARLSKEYLPTQRSLSQEYGVPRTFDNSEYSADYTPSQQYGVPSARLGDDRFNSETLSREYGLPTSRLNSQEEYSLKTRTLAQDYEVPANPLSSARLSQSYGPPARTIDTSVRDLTRQYGVPKSRSQNTQKSQFPNLRASQVPSTLGAPQIKNIPSLGVPQDFSVAAKSLDSSFPSDSYGAPLQRSFDSISLEYGVPQTEKPVFRSSVAQTYGTPRSADSYSKMTRFGAGSQNEVSMSYGAPKLSAQYGVPSAARSSKPSETYGVPNSRSFDAGRSSNAFISSSYLPPSRNAMPSTEYGVPDVNSLSRQGYSYSRNALDELINQEPANYDFGYKVNDLRSGSDFGHTETRQENKAEGSYFVVLPDGTKQIVEYEADDQGFRPRISVEAVNQGYDDNAANLSKSGPY